MSSCVSTTYVVRSAHVVALVAMCAQRARCECDDDMDDERRMIHSAVCVCVGPSSVSVRWLVWHMCPLRSLDKLDTVRANKTSL
jgi:hypothetical protein